MKYIILLLIAGLVVFGLRSKASQRRNQEPRGSDVQQVIQNSDQKILLVFWKPNCPGCEYAEPLVAQLEKDYPAVKVIRINTKLSENRAIRGEYGVNGTPTLVLVEKGKMLRRNEGGFSNKQGLLGFVRPSAVY